MTGPFTPGGLHRAFLTQQLPGWIKYATGRDIQRLRDTQLDAQYSAAGLADWFTRATAQQQQALLDSQARLRSAKRGLAGLLKHFKGITDFAEPLLKARLKADFGLELDVHAAQFVRLAREWKFNGRWQDVTAHTQSLLQAALQNFDKHATFSADDCLTTDGGYSVADKVIYQPAVVTFTHPLALTVQAFAQLCHDLDLGRLYQQHLAEVYDTPLSSSRIRYRSIEVYQGLLQVQMQVALMKSELSQAACDALASLIDGHASPHYQGQPLSVVQLSMYGMPLSGPWVLSAVASDSVHPVIVYLPGAPLYPLKEYPSLKAFKDDLRINLSQPAYVELFRGYVAKDQEQAFTDVLQQNLYHAVAGVGPAEFNPSGSLKLRNRAVAPELFKALHDQQLEKLKADAKVLVVPSAEVDAQASRARWAFWESLGANGLNLAALFVPVLGEVMAAVMAEQLMLDAIEGADAWSNADRATAWSHLEALGLNLAIAAGLAGASTLLPKIDSSAALDELVPIELPSGERRLWRADLRPYAKAVELGNATPDAQGLYTLGDKRYVRIDQRVFEVAKDAAGTWRIESDIAEAYRPELTAYGDVAWQAYGERPLRWGRRQLLRRLGHMTDGLSDTQLQQAADISGTGDDVLRKVHVDRLPAPPLLADTLRRMRVEHQVQRLITHLRSGGAIGQDLGFSAELAIELPHWPGWVIEVFDGPELWGTSTLYGRDRFELGQTVRLTRDDLYAGRLPQVLLDTLSEPAIESLLGQHVAPGQQLQVLRDLLADQAEQRRRAIFESFYTSGREARSVAVACLLRDFPTVPDEVATELVQQATTRERLMLQRTPGRVPLRLAEEIRASQRQVKLNRALEGLQSRRLASLESDQLAVGMLEGLDGWSGTVRLELRRQTFDGERLAAAGGQQGSLKVVARSEDGYLAYDGEGQGLDGARTDFFDSVLHALPDSERTAVGLQVHDADGLRGLVLALAVADRARAAKVLGLTPSRPWFRSPMRLADGRLGYLLSGRGAVGGGRSGALVERVRSLYPAMDADEASRFLDELGLAEEDLANAVEQRVKALQTLRGELGRWVRTAQYHVPEQGAPAQVPEMTLAVVASRIESAWRRETEVVTTAEGLRVGYVLDLNGFNLARLPVLSVDMEHVAELRLHGMGLATLPEAFARQFPRLRWLSLRNNRLARLPEALLHLPGLTKLDLGQNAIVLDDEANRVFASLRQLKILKLEGNPLGRAPDVTPLTALRGMYLRNTGIDAWPDGVFGLAQLELLDLRENRIVSVPAQVLQPEPAQEAAVRNINAVTSLHGNPLDDQSRARLTVYRQNTGLNLGVIPTLRVHAAREEGPVERWLNGVPVAEVAARTQQWNALLAEPEGGELFRLLNDLRNTSDFLRGYYHLRDRVWRMLDAMAADTHLRDELFEQAAHPATCADGVILVFSQLEVRVLVSEAMALSGRQGVERDLMELARGLFRLDQLEVFALRDIAARKADYRGVDEVEVRLAYRVKLASKLDLPGQPTSMAFAQLAGTLDLEGARAFVLAADTPAALKTSIAQRDFWLKYLRDQYAERFETLNKPYFARLEAVEADKTTMTDQVYKDQVETIDRRRRAEESRMVEGLTAQIWNDLPEQQTRL